MDAGGLRSSGIPPEDSRMAKPDPYAELIAHLRGAGHSEDEIEKILTRVRTYERQIQHDSIMDSIGDGSLDLASIIKEALG
jgi:hypothetical protein